MDDLLHLDESIHKMIKDGLKAVLKEDAKQYITRLTIKPEKKDFIVHYLDGTLEMKPFDFEMYAMYIQKLESQKIVSTTELKNQLDNGIVMVLWAPTAVSLLLSILDVYILNNLVTDLEDILMKVLLTLMLFFVQLSWFTKEIMNKSEEKPLETYVGYSKLYVLYMKHKDVFKIKLQNPKTKEIYEYCFCNLTHLPLFYGVRHLQNYIDVIQENQDKFIKYYTELFYSDISLQNDDISRAVNIPFMLPEFPQIILPSEDVYYMDEGLKDIYEVSVKEEIEKIKAKVLGLNTNKE